MKVTWIGHACFKLEKDDMCVVLDAYEPGYVPGLSPVCETADLALFSHFHKDHYSPGSVRVVPGPHKIGVTKIETFHDASGGSERGSNTIHVIQLGDEKAVHLGDLGCALTEEQIACIAGADVCMIPIGGFFTIDAAQAAALLKQIRPKLAVPMHYRDDAAGFGYDRIDTVDAFLEMAGDACVSDSCTVETGHARASVVALKPQNLTDRS